MLVKKKVISWVIFFICLTDQTELYLSYEVLFLDGIDSYGL